MFPGRSALRLSKSLPPLESLRVFQEVARLGGFRKAGEELLISQSAVSHHIRKLEQMLGHPLFHRHAKSISLTGDGQMLLDATVTGFGVIGEAVTRIRQTGQADPLRVSLLPSFASNWLLPRMERLRAQHGDLAIRLDPTLDLADVARGEADLAIRYSAYRGTPGTRLLFREALCPVAAPGYLDNAMLDDPRSVLSYPLLDSLGGRDWRIWLAAHGLTAPDDQFVQLRDYNVVLEAAASGLGVGMGRTRLIDSLLGAGRLVTCATQVVESDEAAHWLMLAEGPAVHSGARRVVDWLLSETEPYRQG